MAEVPHSRHTLHIVPDHKNPHQRQPARMHQFKLLLDVRLRVSAIQEILRADAQLSRQLFQLRLARSIHRRRSCRETTLRKKVKRKSVDTTAACRLEIDRSWVHSCGLSWIACLESQLIAPLNPNFPLRLFDEHRMNFSDQPQLLLPLRAPVEFSFAIEVTLSDSEISSRDACHKATWSTSPVFHFSYQK